jgi:hypothetical protein
LVCDFSGQHRAQHYETYAFLLLDLDKNSAWLAGQRLFRQTLLPTRRMSFKNLGDRHRRRALPHFLRLAQSISGCLVIVAIPRGGGSLFEQNVQPSEAALLQLWKPAVQERLLRILHLSSFLISGFTVPNQDVLWIVDEDDVAANEAQLTQLTGLLGQISSSYLQHDLGHLRCGTTRSDDGTIALEDLAAIPDLGAGAFSEIGTAMVSQGLSSARGIATPLPSRLSWKSRLLAGWLASDEGSLLRLTYILRMDKQSPGIGVTVLKWHAIPAPGLILPYQATGEK